MPSLELVVAGFLTVALAASIISSKSKAPYTLVLVFFGLIIASSSLSTLLNVNFLYDRLIGGGLFVGLVLPPLLFETTMSIRYEEFRSVARPALRLATIEVVNEQDLYLLGHRRFISLAEWSPSVKPL